MSIMAIKRLGDLSTFVFFSSHPLLEKNPPVITKELYNVRVMDTDNGQFSEKGRFMKP